MSPSSTAASVGVGVLLIAAWLASALNAPKAPAPQPRAPVVSKSEQLSELRADVQMQAQRLRERLAEAPAPRPGTRNPFRFEPRPAPSSAVRAAVADADVPTPMIDAPPAEAILTLIGVAEEKKDDALVRTAIISGVGDELYLVVEGDEVAGQYRVRAVSAGAVELEHIATGTIRRLHLQ